MRVWPDNSEKLNESQLMKYLMLSVILMSVALSSFAENRTALKPGRRKREIPARYYQELAAVHQKYGMNQQAIQAYEQALELEQNKRTRRVIMVETAKLYLDLAQNEPAAELFQKAVAETEKAVEKGMLLLQIADQYYQKKDFARYENTLQRVIALDKDLPQRGQAKRKLLQLYKQQHRIQETIFRLEALLKSDPGDTETLQDLVTIYIEIERDSKKALPYLEKLSELNQDDRRAAMQLASMYKTHKLYNKAIALYQQRLERGDPREARFCREMLVGIYLELNDEKQAAKYAAEMLKQDPGDPFINHRLAMLYSRSAFSDKAAGYYRKAIAGADLPRKKFGLQRQLAEFLLRAKKNGQARELLREMAAGDNNAARDYAVKKIKMLDTGAAGPKKK